VTVAVGIHNILAGKQGSSVQLVNPFVLFL